MRWFLGICAIAALTLSSRAGAGEVAVFLQPWSTRSLATYKGHESETLREQMARFVGTATPFAISYKAGYREDRPGEAFPLEGYIGMPLPVACNWYHSGFLRVLVNGQDIGRAALTSMTVTETGQRGILDLVWHPATGPVRVRFLALPDDDRLFCEARTDAAQENCQISLQLSCYPSFFTAHHHRVGDRRVLTPTSEVKENEKRELPVETDNWAFYQDTVFDPARQEGDGPCAVLIGPAAGARIRHEPGGYAVQTRVDFPPGTQAARLVFWDFAGLDNATALARFQAAAGPTRTALAGLDFTPARLRAADFATLRQQVTALLDQATNAGVAESDMAPARTWLEEMPTATVGVLAEENQSRWLDDYDTFRWNLQLAALLSRI